MSEDKGIFCGLEKLANKYLLDPTWTRKDEKPTGFGHKTNCLRLSGDTAPDFFEAECIVREMFERIKSNIDCKIATDEKKGKRSPSSANWNFSYRDKSNPEAKKESKKPEVTLERAIIQARRMPNQKFEDKWTYQMPVATGLFDSDTDKASNIDLVRKQSDGVFDLIELKIGSNNPLFAAVEILQYGLAYAASRQLAQKIEYDTGKLEILKAKQIHLCVLAPRKFYELRKTPRYNFRWLEEGLNNALLQFSEKYGYKMSFKFCLLDYEWAPTGSPDKKALDDINEAIKNIRSVPWGNPTKK